MECRCITLCASQAREQHHLRTPSPSESTTSRNTRGRGGHTLAGVKVRVGNCLSRGTGGCGMPAAGPSCGLPGDDVAMKSTMVVNGTGSVVIDVDECRQCPAGLQQSSNHPPVVMRWQTTQLTSNAVPYGVRPHPDSSYSFPAALATASQTTPKVDSGSTERSRRHDRHHLFQQNRIQHQYQQQQQHQRSDRNELTQLCEYGGYMIRRSIV